MLFHVEHVILLHQHENHVIEAMRLIELLRCSGISISGLTDENMLCGLFPDEIPQEIAGEDSGAHGLALSGLLTHVMKDEYEKDMDRFRSSSNVKSKRIGKKGPAKNRCIFVMTSVIGR